ncbi:root hair defective 3 GTP-binding protein-domain-containing protein [Flammula alnicola]|nr:root hair defective 3 GTP-binding protein-domain-containing protein [Flammula alnicola]
MEGYIVLNGTSSVEECNEQIQIVDEDKNFRSDFGQRIERWGLQGAGFEYNIVSVLGTQSTGKSTLLNRLFGTTFDVMDERKRQQTTKGIWMCRGKDISILVMDVEGTDGRERGEDQDFERKAALFSLTSSEILIVNLWDHQVGLYKGANMSLLKTALEVNLGLFGKETQDGTSGRTLLLFVIRDHIGQPPLADLQSTVTTDLAHIWESLIKPSDLKDRQLSDYFDLAFTALPHKIFVADKFELEVQELRKRFVDKSHPAYLFKPAYHKRIPADGVAVYMEGIWEKVQMNEDLNLPTQQELLAHFRCDEISARALSEFNQEARTREGLLQAGNVVNGLGGMMRKWRSDALSLYDRDASRYNESVYKNKRADVVVALNATCSPLYILQLKNLRQACLTAFKQLMFDMVRVEKTKFSTAFTTNSSSCEERFITDAKEASVEGMECKWAVEFKLLQEDIRTTAPQYRDGVKEKVLQFIQYCTEVEVPSLTRVCYSLLIASQLWTVVLFVSRLRKVWSMITALIRMPFLPLALPFVLIVWVVRRYITTTPKREKVLQ